MDPFFKVILIVSAHACARCTKLDFKLKSNLHKSVSIFFSRGSPGVSESMFLPLNGAEHEISLLGLLL